MSLRVPCLALLIMCLSGCLTLKPEDSEYVPLSTALQIVARDLNQATPVVLSDIDNNQAPLKNAIKAYQCADNVADPALFVITGPVSLQLQGSIQKQGQGSASSSPPYVGFQIQKTKAQQQQLTVPITFVAASALPNFFLGQNLTNISTLPDLPDPKSPDSKADAKGPPPDACAYPACDKIKLGQEKATYQLKLIKQADDIRTAVSAQIAAVTQSGAYVAPSDCPKEGVNFVLPSIAVVLPQALKTMAQ